MNAGADGGEDPAADPEDENRCCKAAQTDRTQAGIQFCRIIELVFIKYTWFYTGFHTSNVLEDMYVREALKKIPRNVYHSQWQICCVRCKLDVIKTGHSILR